MRLTILYDEWSLTLNILPANIMTYVILRQWKLDILGETEQVGSPDYLVFRTAEGVLLIEVS